MQSDVSRPFGVYAREQGWRLDKRTKDVESAISLGKLLAKRLQIRNEERVDKSTRLRSGKIDKRLLHEIGFDNYEIFNKISINKYKDSYIHLSIDASGSMQGDKFDESVKLAAMFATASKLIRNLRVVVTARSTINQNYYGYTNKGKSDMNDTPYMVYLFDSKQDGIADIRRIFPRLYSTNTTPEGLTFEAIMNDIYKESTNTDAFFINLCDGQPFMSKEIGKLNGFRYAGQSAQDHSRRQVDRMRSHGINVLTYFIGRKYDFEEVLKCYKTNCHHLANAEELNKVVQSMNAELLSASRKTHG
jgi:nitric oxide reductase activation protein